jgi:hypothetical protein
MRIVFSLRIEIQGWRQRGGVVEGTPIPLLAAQQGWRALLQSFLKFSAINGVFFNVF